MDTVLTTHDVKIVQVLIAPFREFELDLVSQYRLDQLMAEAYREWRKDMNGTALQYTVTINHGVTINLECQVSWANSASQKTLSALVNMLPERR